MIASVDEYIFILEIIGFVKASGPSLFFNISTNCSEEFLEKSQNITEKSDLRLNNARDLCES